MGNDNTGYKVPLAPAFDIIAAIIVEATASPTFPSINDMAKSEKFLIINESNRAEYKKAIIIFMQKTRIKLNRSFPKNIVEGAATKCNAKLVPLSSSETKTRANPDIAEKNITTQNNPPDKFCEIFSFPIENNITLIATIINIAKEFTA